jgi:hypothetical protein
MRFFNKKGFARHTSPNGKIDWERLFADYKAYLDSIRDRLPPNWQALADADFHDLRIVSIERPSKDELTMVLNLATLRFTGVRFSWVPKSVVDDCWLYWEVSPSDEGGFDLEVRLIHDEIRIIADDVTIEDTAKYPKREYRRRRHSRKV